MPLKVKPLRIGYLAQQSGMSLNNRGGGAVHVKGIIRSLQKAGHVVTYLTFGSPVRQVVYTHDLVSVEAAKTRITSTAPFKLFESGVRRLQRELKLPYLALFDSLRYYEACRNTLRGYDLIHERFSMLGLGGMLAGSKMGIPVVLEVNADLLEEEDMLFGSSPRGVERQVKRRACELIFKNAARIVAVSNPLKAQLIQKWGVSKEKIVVLPNGADVENYDPGTDPVEMRACLGLVEAPAVIFVSGFYPWHASVDLVESFEIVSRQLPEARLYLIGNGPMIPKTKEFVHQLGLDERVVFTGAILHEEIPRWLAAADVAVAPYIQYDKDLWFSPLKLFEYMAAGKAIVASRVGQIDEIIQDGQNGVLVEPGDKAGFARAIIDLLQAPANRRRLGENARRQAVERHSWDQVGRQLERIYFDVLEQHKGRVLS